MRRNHDRFTFKGIAFLTIAATAFLLVVVKPASAQRPPPNQSNSARSSGRMSSGAQIGMEQEMQVRGDVRDRGPETEDKLREILNELNEDFQRLQTISDNLLLMVNGNDGFNYTRISELSAEVRKRARRFRDNGNFPPPAAAPKDEKKVGEIGQAQEMKEALLLLNDRINKFVDNPLFKSPEWTDKDQRARASRDLETIIEMSVQIKKGAEKLGKE